MEMLEFSLEAMQVDKSRNESIREAAVWTCAEEGQKMAAKTGTADRRTKVEIYGCDDTRTQK